MEMWKIEISSAWWAEIPNWGAITHAKVRTRLTRGFIEPRLVIYWQNSAEWRQKHDRKKAGITWISLTFRPVTIDYKKKNLKNRLWIIQNSKPNWKRQLFFHFYSSSLFMPSRSDEHTFLLAFGTIQMTREGGGRVENVRLNHIQAPFKTRQLFERKRGRMDSNWRNFKITFGKHRLHYLKTCSK